MKVVRIAELGDHGIHRVVQQDTLAVTAGNSGAEIIDISDPRAAKVLSRFESPYVESVALEGQYLYIAEGHRGMKVLDLHSPERPVVVSTCPEVYAVDIAAYGEYALVADSEKIQVIQVLIPDWLRRSGSVPEDPQGS